VTELGMKFFGEKWDAPTTDDAEWIPTPTHATCMSCLAHFEEGDQGLVYVTGFHQHKECGLRSVMGGIGHLVDHAYYCHGELGTDAGLPYRVSAQLVWEWFVNKQRVTREDLEVLREAHLED
jgi:hypothetical protein